MILLIGSQGRMGKRYSAILDQLKVKWHGIDIKKQPWDYDIIKKCKKAIIATPVDTHFSWCSTLKIPWICEKPLSKNIDEVDKLLTLTQMNNVEGRMINNWENAICIALQEYTANRGDCCVLGDIELYYDKIYSGEDGIWDFIQLIHLCGKGLYIKHASKDLKCYIKKPYMDVKITQEIIERSYLITIKRWLNIPPTPGDMDAGWGRGGWSLQESLQAHKEVLKWKKRQS